jgi:hypothetical protein
VQMAICRVSPHSATFLDAPCPPHCRPEPARRGVPLSDPTASVLILCVPRQSSYTGMALVSPHTLLCCGTYSSFSCWPRCPRQQVWLRHRVMPQARCARRKRIDMRRPHRTRARASAHPHGAQLIREARPFDTPARVAPVRTQRVVITPDRSTAIVRRIRRTHPQSNVPSRPLLQIPPLKQFPSVACGSPPCPLRSAGPLNRSRARMR